MPRITVPQSFFVSERDNIYADWKTAFWRELLSNALDAGSDRIHVRTRFDAAGAMISDVIDNGHGMSREVIEDVYMRLGSSTKIDEPGSVGGFGRARILTCFSQLSYQIRTSNLVVSGSGSDFEILETPDRVQGCALSIRSDPRYAFSLHSGLISVLRQSSLRARVTLDLAKERPDGTALPYPTPDLIEHREGERHPRFRGWSRKGRAFGEIADEDGQWAKLHLSEGDKGLKRRAILRVNGMAMYEETIAAPVQVIIDLAPERARSVLTASRDSIRHEFRSRLQSIFARIAADHRSAFRDRAQAPQVHFDRTGTAMQSGRISDLQAGIRSAILIADGPGSDTDATRADREFQAGRSADGLGQQSPENIDGRHEGLRLPVVVKIDAPTAAQRAVAARYRGETWISGQGEGRSAELLHAAWFAACKCALRALVEIRPEIGAETFVCGFVFDKGVRAMHGRIQEIEHGLLLNPVDENGRMAFRTSDPDDMKRMFAMAIHEVTHCIHDWHDEAFAGTMTEIMGMVRDRDMEREIRDELALARQWMEARTARAEPVPAP